MPLSQPLSISKRGHGGQKEPRDTDSKEKVIVDILPSRDIPLYGNYILQQIISYGI